MPISLANLFRAMVVGVLAVHVFYMYSVARAMHGDFGFDVGTALLAAMFSMVMLLPFVWAVTLPEWPEVYARHVRARRWYREGRCAACGYRLSGQGAVCSECGAINVPPEAYSVSWRTVRTFVIVNVLAWMLGSMTAEVLAGEDERAFVREADAHVQTGATADYARARRWPVGSSTLVYEANERQFVSIRTQSR